MYIVALKFFFLSLFLCMCTSHSFHFRLYRSGFYLPFSQYFTFFLSLFIRRFLQSENIRRFMIYKFSVIWENESEKSIENVWDARTNYVHQTANETKTSEIDYFKINTKSVSANKLNITTAVVQYIHAYKNVICMNFAGRSVIKLLCREVAQYRLWNRKKNCVENKKKK